MLGEQLRSYLPAVVDRWYAPRVRFVIVTTGRAGSELLVSLLDSHPDIICAGELLKQGRLLPDQFVAARSVMARVKGAQAFGWKLLVSQFRNPAATVHGVGAPEAYPQRLHEMGFKLIVLTRRNLLDMALSSYFALTTGEFHRRSSRMRSQLAPQIVDPVHLLAATYIGCLENELINDITRELPRLEIVYEDDLLDPARHQPTVDRICAFLELASAQVRTDFVKTAPQPATNLIANLDEVVELFAMTPFADQFGEPALSAAKLRSTGGRGTQAGLREGAFARGSHP